MPEIWSGVFEGKTDGTSIGILFRNTDQRSDDYGDIKDKYRPGHADFTFDAKFGFRDLPRRRPIQRPRDRLPRRRRRHRQEAAGPLRHPRSRLRQAGRRRAVAEIADPSAVTLEQVEANPVRCPDPNAARRDGRADRGSAQGPGFDRRRLRTGRGRRAAGTGRAGLRQAQGRPGQGAAVAAGGDRRSSTAPASPSPRCAAARTTTPSFAGTARIGTEQSPRRHARRHSAAASRSSAASPSSRPAACRGRSTP